MKNPRFSDRGCIYFVWCSSALSHMGHKPDAAGQLIGLFGHKEPPFLVLFPHYTMKGGSNQPLPGQGVSLY